MESDTDGGEQPEGGMDDLPPGCSEEGTAPAVVVPGDNMDKVTPVPATTEGVLILNDDDESLRRARKRQLEISYWEKKIELVEAQLKYYKKKIRILNGEV